MPFVVDNSVVSGWYLANQTTAYTDAIAERLERGSLELAEFVEEQDTAMGEAHFSRARRIASTSQRNVAHRVVGSAKGARVRRRRAAREQTGDAVDGHHLERLVV